MNRVSVHPPRRSEQEDTTAHEGEDDMDARGTERTATGSWAVAGRAPVLIPAQQHLHTSTGQFCSVCGTVWPCATAARQQRAAARSTLRRAGV